MRIALLFLLTLSFLISSICLGSSQNENSKGKNCGQTPVVNAVADLRCWDIQTSISLSGEWQLNYQSLEGNVTYNDLAPVPYRWRESPLELPYLGKGIYQVKLLFSVPQKGLGLKLSQTEMARKVIIINAQGIETVVFDTGQTDFSEDSTIRMRVPIIALPDLGTESKLIIHVNNTISIHGGINSTPVIGTFNALTRLDQITKYIIMIMVSILVVFCILNVYVWAVRNTSFSVLALAVLSLLLALRQLVVSGIFYDFAPSLSSNFHSGVGWGTYLFGMMLGYGYFRTSAPHLIPKWLTIIVSLVSIIGIGLYLFEPLYVVQLYGAYYRPFTFFTTFILVAFMISGLRNCDTSLKVTVLSGSVLLVSFAADIFFFHLAGYYPLISTTSIGMLVFVGAETIMIFNKYWDSIQQSAKLSKELKVLNAKLEDKVKERTAEIVLKNELLETISSTDVLTGLANRRAFDVAVNKEIERSKRNNQSLIICIIDLDYFKNINDAYGHDTGDIVLKSIGKLLLNCLRDNDFAARWGGEEFCLLFPETDSEEAINVANRIRELITELEWRIGNKKLSLTASFGLAIWQKSHNFNMVFKDADNALFKAKEQGRNQVVAAWL